MIYPILAYGHPILRTRAQEITADYPGLAEVIANMYETMYNAKGVGLAAPQIGKAIRIFVVDGSPMEGTLEDDPTPMEGWKKVFINPTKLSEHGEPWGYDEGCLSIPDVIEEVYREENVHLRYFDENWVQHEETFSGLRARVIQHEYDHLEGVLFTDYLRGLRKQLVKSRLLRIAKGKYSTFYPMSIGVKSK
jgi:peptide deformylase